MIKDFSISYVTHGTLNAKKSNAILMVTAISGNHHRLDFLIGPGKALDTNKYFIIATDAIGNGLTTSPSNSTAQPRCSSPGSPSGTWSTSQHRLLTEHLGIDHVVTVIGPSMGGMQVLQWGVSYPEFMDGLVALVPLARTPAWSIVIVDASPQGHHARPGVEGGKLRKPAGRGHTPVARHAVAYSRAKLGFAMTETSSSSAADVLPWLAQQVRHRPAFEPTTDLPDLGLRGPRRGTPA